MTKKPKLDARSQAFLEIFQKMGVTFIDAETEAEFEAKAWKCYDELDVTEKTEPALTIGEALDHLQHTFDYMGACLDALPGGTISMGDALDRAYGKLNSIREMLGEQNK